MSRRLNWTTSGDSGVPCWRMTLKSLRQMFNEQEHGSPGKDAMDVWTLEGRCPNLRLTEVINILNTLPRTECIYFWFQDVQRQEHCRWWQTAQVKRGSAACKTQSRPSPLRSLKSLVMESNQSYRLLKEVTQTKRRPGATLRSQAQIYPDAHRPSVVWARCLSYQGRTKKKRVKSLRKAETVKTQHRSSGLDVESNMRLWEPRSKFAWHEFTCVDMSESDTPNRCYSVSKCL